MSRGVVAVVLLSAVAIGCDKGEEASDKGSGKDADAAPSDDGGAKKAEDDGANEADAKEPAAAGGEAAQKKDGKDEDKGHAKLKLGDEDWSVERASARVKDGTLQITASRFETVDGKKRREALKLVVKDYKGPGSYVSKNFDSNFSGVGFDTKKLEEAEKEGDAKKVDAVATKEATNALQGASVVLLKQAKIEITAANDDFIDGSVEWKGITALRGPKSLSGTFHARIRKNKPK